MSTESSDSYLPYYPRFQGSSFWYREREELESIENASRSPLLCQKLEKVVRNPVGGVALALTCDFALSSAEGDEFGIAVVADPKVKSRSTSRVLAAASYALSGFTLDDYWRIVWRFLAWGDCFASVTIGSNDRFKPVLLPTWQIHLEVDEWDGELLAVKQYRPGLIQEEREVNKDTFVHWSYRKNYIYGRSLYYEVMDSSIYYQQNSEDIAFASRAVALAANIHIMPEGADSAYLQDYKQDHKQQLKHGPVSDIYLLHGAEVKTGDRIGLPLSAMLDSLKFRRLEIAVASRVPLYLLGIEYKSAREISLQPALTFRHHIGRVRSILAAGLRGIIDDYLQERGFNPPYGYNLKFPSIDLSPFGTPADDNLPGIEDTDG